MKWSPKIETTTRYNSYTGAKIDETAYWIQGESERYVGVICSHYFESEEKIKEALNLLCAAPDMYEALEKLLNHCAHIPDIPLNTLAKCADALKKARGEGI